MKEKVRKYTGAILLIIGSFITAYNLFNFRASRFCGIESPSNWANNVNNNCPVSYYYDDITLILLGVGVALIITGVLIIKNKKINNATVV